MDGILGKEPLSPVKIPVPEPTPEPLPQSLGKLKIILVIFGVLILFIGGGGLIFNRYMRTIVSQPVPSPTPPVSQTLSQSTIVLPIDLDNPNIDSLYLAYNFRGKILEVKNTTQGLELVLDIKGSGIPRFIFTSETQFLFSTPDRNAAASINDLKPNGKVRILAIYNYKKKQWSVIRVVIEVDSLPTVVPPAPTH